MADVVAESDGFLADSLLSIAQQVANFCTNTLHCMVSDHNILAAHLLKNYGHGDKRQ